jgi:dihydroxyacetone kinase
MARGGASLGEKTLLDALVPMTDAIETGVSEGASSQEIVDRAAVAARQAADATVDMVAKRGRAAYTGERSRGSVDAGATAVAVIIEQIAEVWKTRESR